MNRPLLLRLLPTSIRESVCERYYRSRRNQWLDLYKRAFLKFAPAISMENLLPGDVISDYIAFTGVYEAGLSRYIARLGRRGGFMIDAGANMGYFSLLWASGNPKNRVVSFEASPRNIGFLRHNVEHNKLTNQVQVISKAVSKESGILPFSVGSEEQTGWGGFAPSTTTTTIDVEVVRIDDLIGTDEEIALLKIDIEGADTWALFGCEKLLRGRRIKEIWFEQNKSRMRGFGIGETEAEKFLQSCGYKAEPRSNPKADVVEWCAVPM